MRVKLRDFISPFSTSNYLVHIEYRSDDLSAQDLDEIKDRYGDYIVTDVDLDFDLIQIYASRDRGE